jgi:hypothetical protein
MNSYIHIAWIVSGLLVLHAGTKAVLALFGGALRSGSGAKPKPALLLLAVALIGVLLGLASVPSGLNVLAWFLRNRGWSPPEAGPAIAAAHEAALAERLDTELERLQDRIDALHADGVAREVSVTPFEGTTIPIWRAPLVSQA